MKIFILFNKIQIELAGMSVRAFTSLTVSVRKHRNPKHFGASHRYFTPDYGRGAVGYILKSNGITELLIVNTPTVIFVTVFIWGNISDKTLMSFITPPFIREDLCNI